MIAQYAWYEHGAAFYLPRYTVVVSDPAEVPGRVAGVGHLVELAGVMTEEPLQHGPWRCQWDGGAGSAPGVSLEFIFNPLFDGRCARGFEKLSTSTSARRESKVVN
jgi:hypothetical protein